MSDDNYFTKLNSLGGEAETKNGFKYLSWSDAWTKLKTHHPFASYTIYENSKGFPCFMTSAGAMVKVGVTVGELEHIEWMPVLDYRNKAIKAEVLTVFDINKSIQRALTKAIAKHGVGLALYRGEDLPKDDEKGNDPEEDFI